MAGDRLTLDDLKFLLETEKDQERIVVLVRQADDVVLSSGDLDRLKALGAGEALLSALREQLGSGSSLTVRTVLRMLREKRPVAEIVDHILGAGPGLVLSARQKLDLRRAGANADVVRALEGRYVYPGFALYTTDHGLFAVQRPDGWKAVTFHDKNGLHVILSPQTVKRPGDFTTGIDVQMIGRRPSSQSLLERHRRSLPVFLAINRRYALKPAYEAKAVTVDGRPGVEQLLYGTFRETPCALLMVRVVDEDVEFVIQLLAPRAKVAEWGPILRRALRTFRTFPGQKRLFRLRQTLSPTEAIERFRPSVVHVRSLFGNATGFGSGFIVREDGYVLTNHHVICRKKDHGTCTERSKMQLAPKFELVWDSRVGPKPKGAKNRRSPATLVGTVYQSEPFIDLALLKLPPRKTPYRSLPLCRTGRTRATGLVKDGDPVLALGFPLPSRFGVDFLTPTQGAITRLDYRQESGDAQVLDRIRATINIQKGNSGGPLISLVTGGVVGLTTAGGLAIKGETRVVGEQLGHQLASPIDWALHHFPQLRYYPLHRDPPLPAHLELAEMLMGSNLDAAKVELDYVAARVRKLSRVHRADYHYLRHLYARQTNDTKGVLAELDLALGFEPRSFRTLVERVRHTKKINEAIGFADRAVAVKTDSPWGYYHRAAALRRAKRLDEALEDVERSKKNGGASQPDVWQLEGLIRFDRKESDAALKAYRESLRLDPTSIDGGFGVAEYYRRKNDHANVEREFEKVVAGHPDNAKVFDAYSRYLAGRPARKEAALKHSERAIELSLKQGGKPWVGTLRRASKLATELGPRYTTRAVRAAVLLSRHWSAWRRDAHAQLGFAWEKAGRPALAFAHFKASDPRGFFGRLKRQKPVPLPFADVDAIVRTQYDPSLFAEVLSSTTLGFVWSFAVKTGNIAKRWQFWQVFALRRRMENKTRKPPPKKIRPRRVSLMPSIQLGRLVKVSYEGSVNSKSAYAPSSRVIFKNTGRTPLMDLQARIKVIRTVGKKQTVLGVKTRNVHLVLQPGEAYKMRFAWIPWSEMKKLGIDRNKVTHYSCSILAAVNASVLKYVKVRGAYRKDKSVYDYTVTNTSTTPLRNVQIRCDFVDTKGRPIPRDDGTPAHMWAFIPGTLQPGKSFSGSSKSWADWKQIRNLGVKANNVTVRLVVAHAKAGKPR